MGEIWTGLPKATANGFHRKISARWFQDRSPATLFNGVSSTCTKLKKHRDFETKSKASLACAEDSAPNRCHPHTQTLFRKVLPEPALLPAGCH